MLYMSLTLKTKVVNRILPCRRTVVEVDAWEMSLGNTMLTGRAEVAAAMVPVPYEPELGWLPCIATFASHVTYRIYPGQTKYPADKKNPDRSEIVCGCIGFLIKTFSPGCVILSHMFGSIIWVYSNFI